jgi:predicted secreted hydrolase
MLLARGFLIPCLLLSLLSAGRAAAASALFREAQPGRTLEFPRDHGVHPDFKQEWWYYSGHLESPGGGLLGYQVTFFRLALESPHPLNSPAASAQNIFAAHLALTIPATGAFISRHKIVPEILGLAGASPHRLQVNVEDWRLETQGAAHLLRLHSPDLSLDLTLTPSRPLTLHGQAGYVAKDAKIGSSYHYSITRLATTGEVAYGGRSFKVTGTSWFDREFCTTLLGPRQPGWDWFALQLTDGRDVMLYFPREPHGRPSPHAYGAIVDPDGRVHRLACGDFRLTPTGAWKSPRTAATYPAGWRLIIPGNGTSLTIVPTVAGQEVSLSGLAALTYWEGQVTVTGHHGPQPVSGRGYAELTGYARPVPRSFDAPEKWAPKPPP